MNVLRAVDLANVIGPVELEVCRSSHKQYKIPGLTTTQRKTSSRSGNSRQMLLHLQQGGRWLGDLLALVCVLVAGTGSRADRSSSEPAASTARARQVGRAIVAAPSEVPDVVRIEVERPPGKRQAF